MYLCSPIQTIGVWRSWLAHLVWDQRVLCSSHSTPTQKKSNHLIFRWLLFFSFLWVLGYNGYNGINGKSMLISGGAAGGHQKYLPTAALRNDSVDQTLPLLA